MNNQIEGIKIDPSMTNVPATTAQRVAATTSTPWFPPPTLPVTSTPWFPATTVAQVAPTVTPTALAAATTQVTSAGQAAASKVAGQAAASLGSDVAATTAVGDLATKIGPLNHLAFGLGAAMTLMQAKSAGDTAEAQGANIKSRIEQEQSIAKNREQLENLELRDTIEQINTKGIKGRASFQAAKGEGLAGATYNAILQDYKRNELGMRERVVDQVVQNRIQVRENLMLSYTQALRDIDILKDSVPSYAEVALQIGVQAVAAYATGGSSLFVGA
ncbi:MAG: hypothetical protein H8E12_18630 [Rhodobacteraceae bacterium]|nr:hypothetical protein [Paracoccaceae bacterium]